MLFNRFIQPDLDIEKLQVDPSLHLSTSAELLLPLRWMALLSGQVKADLALTTGVHTGLDMVKRSWLVQQSSKWPLNLWPMV